MIFADEFLKFTVKMNKNAGETVEIIGEIALPVCEIIKFTCNSGEISGKVK